jgi:cathepsin L
MVSITVACLSVLFGAAHVFPVLAARTYTVDDRQPAPTYTLGAHHAPPVVRHPGLSFPTDGATPGAFDWRTVRRDGVPPPPVRNQGGCGSCWAFATVAPVEFQLWAASGASVDLSEQYLVSCNQQGFSCGGGGWWAFDELIRDGLISESCYPYTAQDRACAPTGCAPLSLARPAQWGYVHPDEGTPSVSALQTAILRYGPVAVAVAVGNEFYGYRRGVFNYNQAGSINHAVVLVGWNDTLSAWILRVRGRFECV